MELVARDLVFAYDKPDVLRGVSLTARTGERVGVLGPNGCGKSTLLKCLNRKLVPRSGEVTLDGQDLTRLDRAAIARQIGAVPQSATIPYAFTVAEVVLMGRHIHARRGFTKNDHRAAHESLVRVELVALAERPVTELSGGEFQRVLIARALAQESAFLLLDEPTLHLDPAHQLELMDLLEDLSRTHGLGVVMSTHDVNLALRYLDRLVLMKDGRVVAEGVPRDVLATEHLGEAYGIETCILEGPGGEVAIVPMRLTPAMKNGGPTQEDSI
jgi:iron complex transport system ATP-binding protein